MNAATRSDRIVQILHIHRQIEMNNKSLLLLIELCREEPVTILHQHIVTAFKIRPSYYVFEKGEQFHRLLNGLPEDFDPVKELPLFSTFLGKFLSL